MPTTLQPRLCNNNQVCIEISSEATLSSGEAPSNLHPQRHNRRRINVRRRRTRGGRRDHRLPVAGVSASSEATCDNSTPTPLLIGVMKFMVPSLLALWVKNQGKTENLLEYPAMWCYIASTFIYWIITGVMNQMTIDAEYFQLWSRAALASALLSVASVVSLFLPYPFSVWPFVIYILVLPVALVWRKGYSLFLFGKESVANIYHAIVVWTKRFNSTAEASLHV